MLHNPERVRGLESLQFLWQDMLLPLAQSMLPRLLDAMASYAPDVVVADHQAIAGVLAARRLVKASEQALILLGIILRRHDVAPRLLVVRRGRQRAASKSEW